MNTDSFWFQGAGGPGPSPTPVPGTANSLRFRGGNEVLQRQFTNPSSSNTQLTLSYWYKKADPNRTFTTSIGSAGRSGFNRSSPCLFVSPLAPGLEVQGTGWTWLVTYNGSEDFIDPSAWYNIVQTWDVGGQGYRVWINGELVNTSNAPTSTWWADSHG